MTRTRILIVEDEGIVARDIERQLLCLGYDPVGKASTGEEAIALAGTHRPHLVLMDIHLAGTLDGVDAAVAIRAQFAIPSVFLTAYANDEVVERAKRAEPLGYIIKPFDEHSLRTTIEIALHKDKSDGQLRQSEARYRAVVQSANDGIVTADSHGTIVGWSPAAADLFGYTDAEAIGQPVTMLVPVRHLEGHLAGFRRLQSRDRTHTLNRVRELEGRCKDGSEFPLELSVATWETAEGWFVTGMIRNVAERVRSESAARLQSAALSAAANAIVITDRDGLIQWVNPAFCALTGYGCDEAVGRNPRELVKSGVHEASFYEQMWTTLLAGQVWDGEVTNRRKDGTLYVEAQTITPVKNAAGEITNFIGVKRDLTQQKRLQAQFLQAQKMEVVGRLAGGIAHDFNNLLTVINGTADLALSELPATDPMRAEFEQIQEAGSRATRLTRQLLAFSRKQILAPVALNLRAHVSQMASMLCRLVGEDIELVVDAAPELDHVLADPGQIEQVLMNLAVNARDAMPTGGVLTIETRNVMLDHAFAAEQQGISAGPHVALVVTDTGVGMTAEVRQRIFEPFFSTKGAGKGTGLGLATIYGIVQQSGGCILVDSKTGAGTSFTILLPSTSACAATQPADITKAAPGTETILLVEDERDLRDLATRMLRSAGYTVLAASSGQHALSTLQSHDAQVHVVFTDVVMPGMSGADLVADLAVRYPDIRVLFTSGYTDDARLGEGLIAAGGHFIAKPYTAAELTRMLRRVLDSSDAR